MPPALWRKEVAEIRAVPERVRRPRCRRAADANSTSSERRLGCSRARLAALRLSSQTKRIVCGESRSGSRPRPIMPSPLICRLSRRTKASSSPAHLHERAVGALIDEHEFVAVDLDARVQARDQVALDDDVVVLGAADGDCGWRSSTHQLAILHRSRSRMACAPSRASSGDRRHHAGDVLGLPQHLVERDLARPGPLMRRDVDLAAPRRATPATAARPSRRW